MSNLFVITHCESCYNRQQIFTGRVNSRLTAKGHQHAQKIARQLKSKQIDIAYRTSLIRTQETLDHILKYHSHAKIIIDDRLIERDYGSLSRKSKIKYAREHPQTYPIYHRSYDIAPPGGESMKQVEKRVISFLKELIRKMEQQDLNILIVAHSNAIRPIIRYFEHLTPQQMMQLEHLRHKIYSYQIS